jgi:hypothetical protein
MVKRPDPTLHQTARTEITSPFGDLASFIFFPGRIGFARQVPQHLPFAEPTSNNAVPLAHSLAAFPMSVMAGAQRFARCERLRADRVLHALGLDSTVFCREGQREGARKGFNPRRKGRHSHTRSWAALALLPEGTWLRTCGPTADSLTETSWFFWRNARCRAWWWHG